MTPAQWLSIVVFLWKKYSEDNNDMATIKIKQTKSRIGAPIDQKRTLDALGLTKMNRIVEVEDSASLRGMLRKVHHLITIVD